jgi:hypothetical protein
MIRGKGLLFLGGRAVRKLLTIGGRIFSFFLLVRLFIGAHIVLYIGRSVL